MTKQLLTQSKTLLCLATLGTAQLEIAKKLLLDKTKLSDISLLLLDNHDTRNGKISTELNSFIDNDKLKEFFAIQSVEILPEEVQKIQEIIKIHSPRQIIVPSIELLERESILSIARLIECLSSMEAKVNIYAFNEVEHKIAFFPLSLQQLQEKLYPSTSQKIKKLKHELGEFLLSKLKFSLWLKFYQYFRLYPGVIKRLWATLRQKGVSGCLLRLKQLSSLFGVRKYESRQPEAQEIWLDKLKKMQSKPLLSLLVDVSNANLLQFKQTMSSIEQQWYKNWELIIIGSDNSQLELQKFLKIIHDKRVKILPNTSNNNLYKEIAQGDYISNLVCGDMLTIDALCEIALELDKKTSAIIYCDDDQLYSQGNHIEPHFKPDFSPDLLFSKNYIGQFVFIQKNLLLGLESDGQLDSYYSLLQLTAIPRSISHLSKVLLHRAKESSSVTINDLSLSLEQKFIQQTQEKQWLVQSLRQRNIKANVMDGSLPCSYRIRRDIEANLLVSIIVPFKDKPELLTQCVESIVEKSTYKHYEIIGISNNSTEQQTTIEINRLTELYEQFKVYDYNIPFNYSKINNHAVKQYAKGEYLVLLNNDIEIITPDWIEELLSFAQRENVGAVGAKLYYPNDHVQHAGVIVGLGGVAGEAHKFFKRDDSGYMGRLKLIQNFSAVTGACLMVAKDKYHEINGLDEKNLEVAFNDVDFCIRLRDKGYWNVFTPFCEAYHHESISRGLDDTEEKRKRFEREISYMKEVHHTDTKPDPFYNPNLSHHSNDFALALDQT